MYSGFNFFLLGLIKYWLHPKKQAKLQKNIEKNGGQLIILNVFQSNNNSWDSSKYIEIPYYYYFSEWISIRHHFKGCSVFTHTIVFLLQNTSLCNHAKLYPWSSMVESKLIQIWFIRIQLELVWKWSLRNVLNGINGLKPWKIVLWKLAKSL